MKGIKMTPDIKKEKAKIESRVDMIWSEMKDCKPELTAAYFYLTEEENILNDSQKYFDNMDFRYLARTCISLVYGEILIRHRPDDLQKELDKE